MYQQFVLQIHSYWIVTAAHCFCPLTDLVSPGCGVANRGFEKELSNGLPHRWII